MERLIDLAIALPGMQSSGEPMHPLKPGSCLIYRATGTIKGKDPSGKPVQVKVSGTMTVKVLPKSFKDPKGNPVLKRELTHRINFVIGKEKQTQADTVVDYFSYSPTGEERLHGEERFGAIAWVVNPQGYIKTGLARFTVGAKVDTGTFKTTDGSTQRLVMEVKSKETIRVPAGTYVTYMVEGYTIDSEGNTNRFTQWIAPRIGGFVKKRFRFAAPEGMMEVTLDLIEAKLK